ncbi:S8 family peptidase [Amycolatopsis jiangsuensis]|uniref:Subtilisin family serine protease n=1 Tax=Amycolatopsis jiangsuensis TaxID=1181879 RepID=A0A840IY26_9PSEU|nr:S8 family serine peptidase [Amycolatopsis jiangsuensis]MBB4686295.1 subtilisin family serine protease [Amycolatopsis jiangsuensis]
MSRIRRMLVPVTLAGIAAGAVTVPAAAAAPAPSCDTTSTPYSYVVLYQPGASQRSVDAELGAKCGTRVAYYPEIGVAVASSRNADFAERIGVMRAYSGGKDVAAQNAARAHQRSAVGTLEQTRTRAAEGDLSAQQWDMRAIHAQEANKVDEGSSRVTVGVLDSGIDAKHPALSHAVDARSSAGCVTGAADTSASAWAPTNSEHGTHVAGTIAGKDASRGFSGIAPGVRLASVKVVNDDGYIFPEAAVCGFMWAGEHRFQVTNNSYYIDPGMFYCRKEAGDAAAYEAVRRAVTYSSHRGTLNVAAAGNSGFDVTKQTTDPNRPHPVDSSCGILPKSIDGVVTVSSVGYAGTKSSFSNYGAVSVAAPGGDFAQLPPEGQGEGCPLSTVFDGGYGTMCGTSMASPHAAGVAALLASRIPFSPPRLVSALLGAEADPVACDVQECTGPARNNSYYGHGLVNALDAVR